MRRHDFIASDRGHYDGIRTLGAGMRRREFIAGLAGAAAWPVVARAQQSDRIRRISVLTGYVEKDSEAQRRVGAFQSKLRELGWTHGHNVAIDYRWAAASRERMQADAAETASLKPDVVLVVGTPIWQAARKNAVNSPTVFVQIDDPIASGVVPSLARPGGNVTGFTPFERTIGGKMVEVLKEIAPTIRRVGFLMGPGSSFHAAMKQVMDAAAPSFGITIASAVVGDSVELDRAISAFAAQPNPALVVPSYTLTNVHRARIIALTGQHRMPAVYPFRHYVADGGLLSYGIDPADQFREAASYIDRILKGEKPGDLPVQAPTRFELAINLKTAKALGLIVPPTLLARADEVIE